MGPKFNHPCSRKREAEGDLITEGNVKTEAKCYSVGFEVGEWGHESGNARCAALEAEKGKEHILP